MDLAHLIPVSIVLIFLVAQSLRIIPEKKRGAIYRLGRFAKVAGPGAVFIVPFIDKIVEIDLDTCVPHWRSLSPEQLRDKVKDVAQNNPNAHE